MWNPEIRVLESRRLDLSSLDWHLDLRSPFWRIYVNDRKGAWIEFDGKPISLVPEKIWIIPAWVRFRTGLLRPVTQDYIHFTFSGLPDALLQKKFPEPFGLRAPDALAHLAKHWRGSMEMENSFVHLCHASSLVHEIVARLLSRWPASEQADYWHWRAQTAGIGAALDSMENAERPPVSNSELGRLCGMSEDHFIRKFRQLMGTSPARYGRARRIAVAAEWLAGTNRTIEDIAESTGFADRAHFSRVFRQHFNLAPAAYRRAHRTKGNRLLSH